MYAVASLLLVLAAAWVLSHARREYQVRSGEAQCPEPSLMLRQNPSDPGYENTQSEVRSQKIRKEVHQFCKALGEGQKKETNRLALLLQSSAESYLDLDEICKYVVIKADHGLLMQYLGTITCESRREFDNHLARALCVEISRSSAIEGVQACDRLGIEFMDSDDLGFIAAQCALQSDADAYRKLQASKLARPDAPLIVAAAPETMEELRRAGLTFESCIERIQHIEPLASTQSAVLEAIFINGFPTWLGDEPAAIIEALERRSPSVREIAVKALAKQQGSDAGEYLRCNPWLNDRDAVVFAEVWAKWQPVDACAWSMEAGSPEAFRVSFLTYVQRHSRAASQWLTEVDDPTFLGAGSAIIADYLEEDGSHGEARAYRDTAERLRSHE